MQAGDTSAVLNLNHPNSLGDRLRQIRAKIVASGEPLLNREELEKEVASRRGGIENTEE